MLKHIHTITASRALVSVDRSIASKHSVNYGGAHYELCRFWYTESNTITIARFLCAEVASKLHQSPKRGLKGAVIMLSTYGKRMAGNTLKIAFSTLEMKSCNEITSRQRHKRIHFAKDSIALIRYAFPFTAEPNLRLAILSDPGTVGGSAAEVKPSKS